MTHNEKFLQHLWQRGRDFLGVEYAILCGAMTWVSDCNLVSAISNAGGFGIIAGGSMSPELLRQEIIATRLLTDKPFGVNLITMHPELNKLLEIVIAEKISHVFLAGGLPQRGAIEVLKNSQIKVICFTPTLAIAKRLLKQGADALIIEGHEAGGHVGPVTTNILAQEILPYITDKPIFVAGGIGRGESILLYLQMGASGCQLGTRFVCATESRAHLKFKEAFIRASARDAILSMQLDPRFPVIPVRALQNAGMKRFMQLQHELINQVDRGQLELKEAQLQIENFWAGALKRAVIEGDTENGSLMAGQSVGMVNSSQDAREIIQELIEQAIFALDHRPQVNKQIFQRLSLHSS